MPFLFTEYNTAQMSLSDPYIGFQSFSKIFNYSTLRIIDFGIAGTLFLIIHFLNSAALFWFCKTIMQVVAPKQKKSQTFRCGYRAGNATSPKRELSDPGAGFAKHSLINFHSILHAKNQCLLKWYYINILSNAKQLLIL